MKRTRKFAIHYENIRQNEAKQRGIEDLEIELIAVIPLRNVQITIEYETGEAAE